MFFVIRYDLHCGYLVCMWLVELVGDVITRSHINWEYELGNVSLID